MRRFFSIAIIAALLASSVFALLYILQYPGMDVTTMDVTMRGAGNEIVHGRKQEIATANAFAAHGKTTGGSGFPWKDRLRKVLEDCMRAIKNLSTSVGHRIHPRLAPDGVYFTMRYFSVPNAHGITGIVPGTKVIRVREDGSTLRVRTGDVEFQATAQDLTNDLDVADAVSRGDAHAQQALASYLDQQRAIRGSANSTPR